MGRDIGAGAALIDLLRSAARALDPAQPVDPRNPRIRLVLAVDAHEQGGPLKLHVHLGCPSPTVPGSLAYGARSGPVTQEALLGCVQALEQDLEEIRQGRDGGGDPELVLDSPEPTR